MKKKRVWDAAVGRAVRGLLATARFIPWKLATTNAEAVGVLAYHALKRFRGVAEKNLTIAFGDSLTEAERQRIIKNVYKNFTRMALAEFVKAPHLTADDVCRLMDLGPAEDLARGEAVMARGKGLIVVTAHMGNFELLARRIALLGYKFTVVARPNASFRPVMDRLSETGGYQVYSRGSSPKMLLTDLRAGRAIAILPDQKSDDMFVPFFGRMSGTVAGPAVLALKTGAPILPIFSVRKPDGTYRAVIKQEIDTTSKGDHDADVRRIMTDINVVIEEMIREYPDQWLWLHNRWKNAKPPGAEAVTSTAATATRGPERVREPA